MEKRKPTYDLDTIKAAFSTAEKLRMTKTAADCAFTLGLRLNDVVEVIQSTTRAHFRKSMTSIANHRVWQDVYNVPRGELLLYVKFTIDDDGHLLISFKEATR
ncbi:MAG: type II toxin-antitoxin system MqsR family toxin [Deltaproteobacteria bacterium]|nr:type II toxin-antitoxin system MqsR family toxin [Deltaproteobacteria bacterium]